MTYPGIYIYIYIFSYGCPRPITLRIPFPYAPPLPPTPKTKVGRCEQRLKDVAKLRRRQEREDAAADPLPSSDPPVLKENASWGVGKARRGLSPPSPPPPGRTPGLQQPTFGEVGTHEVQVRNEK